jgi:ribonucleoside-diphosphate reductase alpha chain
MSGAPFNNDVSRDIWQRKYRYRENGEILDASIEQTWSRVAAAVASVEASGADRWSERFFDLLKGFRFLPGGRILAGAGTRHEVTLFNCFVMGVIEDSMDGIFSALREGAMTMQQGGGVGYDFSTLRPSGAPARHAGTVSSGPVSFMRIWDSMCETLLSTGNRRGAMMGTLRCDHPDIEHFIDVKRDPRELRNFNLSVLVSDAFMEAVRCDRDWPLYFPLLEGETTEGAMQRTWPGREGAVACRVYRSLPARELWRRIMRANYETAEPGVLFIDRINRENNLQYCERIGATNPCGEIPLPAYGACDLGSLNLTCYVSAPFTRQAAFDWQSFIADTRLAVRFLDNVIDLSHYPLPAQRKRVRATRRIGLGVTGLADFFMMLGFRYGDADSLALVESLFRRLRDCAYESACDLAQEKGSFPLLQADAYLAAPYLQRLPDDLRGRIAKQGIRNSHLLAIAPTGTISLLANNISSGLEPVFGYEYQRNIRQPEGGMGQVKVSDFAWRLWHSLGNESLPAHFVTAMEIAPESHLAMQAAIQPFIDNAISKTINIPVGYSFEQFSSIYQQAYDLGLKGCTTFRPNPVRGEVLSDEKPDLQPDGCCIVD